MELERAGGLWGNSGQGQFTGLGEEHVLYDGVERSGEMGVGSRQLRERLGGSRMQREEAQRGRC